ncbi:sugar-binding domain-containing protein [Flammeovirga sp. OC4]|uniref:glycoside hydrolase family 2 protein n=1 Tax=Flammeovirga sp. OC4 TaxID=1382345 RepID=UPI0009E5AD81|nr:sugar-binding domain-containing protein [Flammeovirga sp. OC4]
MIRYFRLFQFFDMDFNRNGIRCWLITLGLIITLITSCNTNIKLSEIPESPRSKYNFNVDWKFIKANPENAEKIAFDDSDWSTISCPHTFNDIDTFDNFSKGKHDGESDQWRGTVWYRKHFKVPSKDKGKKVYVEFEGVRQIADVYLNGKYLGKNQTGFIPFGYDLTPYLVEGENVLAIKVNNDRGDHFRDNFPLVWNHEHWHPMHGGIYRNVFLHVMNELHVTLPLFDNLKTVGTYVYAENISEKSAEVNVKAEIQNETKTDKKFTIETHVFDNTGKWVTAVHSEEEIKAEGKKAIQSKVVLENPELWSTRYPYMYKVLSVIKQGNKVLDTYESPLGIRTFEFNSDSGFFNNGEYVKLHGWGQKPTNSWAGLGAALPDWLRDFTYQLMDEAGGNFIRWGHCAGSPAEIAMGDKYGFVTLMPGVAGESEDEGETWDIRIDAFRDMVVYYKNHPSIFIWEGGNWAETKEHYEEILDIINTYDPNGKRLMGNRRADLADHSQDYVTIEIGTEGWEGEMVNKPIIESEYCRDESPRRSWDKFTPDDHYFSHPNVKRNTYVMASERFAVRQAEHWWKKMGVKPYHSGGANWVFTDGPHGGRCPTEVTRASGEVDAVRLPKEAFYACKAMWRPEPQVHIVGHWNYTSEVKKPIYVMSNCEKVKLYINDKLIGVDSIPDNGYVFKFDNVQWEEGEIKAEAFLEDKLKISQVKSTAGKAVGLKLTAITGPKGWLADGSDIALIDVEVVDKDGNRCPLEKGKVDFTFSGKGIWRGGYNSGLENSTNNLYLNVEAGINRVAVRSLLEAGKVTVTAKMDGIESAEIELTSKPINFKDGIAFLDPQVFEVIASKEPLPVHVPNIPEQGTKDRLKSALFTKFSYTGDAEALLRKNTFWGKKAYTDLEYNYTHIPRYLHGSEYIRMPNSDAKYWARDQLQFVAGKKMTIYVGHDDRVPLPAFLKEDFTKTKDTFKLGKVKMSLYKREAEKGESIIMAGNSDGEVPEDSRMYVVFGKGK